ncbi:MAG TPA: sulfotransferase [Rhodanobacteraceae bacterium]
MASGQTAAASAALQALLRDAPDHTAARLVLTGVYLQQGQVRAAALEAKQAAASTHDDCEGVTAAAHACMQLGEMRAARDCLARFVAREPNLSGPQLASLAYAYERIGDNPSALALLRMASAHGCSDADFLYFYANQLQFAGDLAGARHVFEDCLDVASDHGHVLWSLAQLPRERANLGYAAAIRAELARADAGSENTAALKFALYRELERDLEYGSAFDALAGGNAIMHAVYPVDTAPREAVFNAISRYTERQPAGSAGALTDGPLPIFIVGLPRCGSTLLAQMLGNHPDVVSTGERSDFPRQLRWMADVAGAEPIDLTLFRRLPDLDYTTLGQRYLDETQWRAEGRRFYVDKLLSNFKLIGPIHRALPQAPIVHLKRAPMGICFSNYRALLGVHYPWSYALDALAAHYCEYRRVMAHWERVLPGAIYAVDYCDLVTRPEATLAALFARCGLQQVAGCTDLARSSAAVNTLSSPQVREPVHTRALNAWRRYGVQLAPLQDALRHAGYAAAPA